MKLTEAQKEILHQRAAEGAQLKDLQKIIQQEFELKITYMETRFLVSDLEISILTEQEDPPKEEDPTSTAEQESLEEGGVQVTVDQVTRPGFMAGGGVTWSDGQASKWAIDSMGRMSLDSDTEGYQPPQEDIESFQLKLRSLLGR